MNAALTFLREVFVLFVILSLCIVLCHENKFSLFQCYAFLFAIRYQATWHFSQYVLAVAVQQKPKMQVHLCEYATCNLWLFQLGTMCRTKIASPLLVCGQECDICFAWQPPTVRALQCQNTQWLHFQLWEVMSSNIFKPTVPISYLC
jgi:hypothetical protein